MALPTTPEPKGSGNYFKPTKDSTTRIRVISDFIEFMEAWKDRKPVRKPVGVKWSPEEHDPPKGEFKNEPQLVWACEIYNYEAKKHQVWCITQKSIRTLLRELDASPHWGSLLTYDIEVKRKDGDKVVYSVTPIPNTPTLTVEVVEAMQAVRAFDGFNINELLRNGDPYKPKDSGIPF